MTTPFPSPTDEDREALAGLVNDRHQETRTWRELKSRTGLARTNGDDYAIETAYRAAEAILAAGFRRSVVSTPSDEVRALIEDLGNWAPVDSPTYHGLMTRAASALEAAVSAPPTITDEMVERAAQSLTGLDDELWAVAREEAEQAFYFDTARAALRAALTPKEDS